jgi:hypothetical protein
MTTLKPFDLVAWLEKNAPEEPKAARPKQAVRSTAAHGGDKSRYILRAFSEEVANVANATDGNRNDQLNKSAFALAQFIAHGLAHGEIVSRLTEAAQSVGLGDDEIAKTINSGIEAGILEPRDLSRVGQSVTHPGPNGTEIPFEFNGHAASNGDGHQDNSGGDDEPDWETTGQEEADRRTRENALKTSFANYIWDEVEDDAGEPKSVKVALSMLQLSDQLEAIVGRWPKRVVEMLFCEGAEYEPTYLGSSARFFAWLGRFAMVDWQRGAQYVTQEQFYEHLRMTSEKYEAIEVLPHYPSIPHLFYMHRAVPRPTGKLDELLKFYSPLTPVDGELIRAMLYTWFWGGAPGARPAFQITGPEGDPEQGRGLGKSKLMETLSVLVNGYLDVNPSDSIADTKVRLLSSEARHMRVCRLDNLKAHRFSWGELEGFITAAVVSGRMLYVGEGRRPNILTWVITVNGSSMSKDMAQRLIPIMLARPAFTAAWEENVINFINKNRWAIIADILQALEKEAPADMKPSSRWAAWERDVLSKTALLTECQAVIKERQGLIDDDREEADLVREAFHNHLLSIYGQHPDGLCILIPSKKAAEWLSECCRKPFATNQASGHIRTLGIKELSPSREKAGRGWIWRGQEVASTQTPLKLEDTFKAGSPSAPYEWTG